MTFNWTCFQFKKSRESIIEKSTYHGVVRFNQRNFALSFSLKFLSNFKHISGAIDPVTPIWASLERSLPLQKLSIDDANFGQSWWHQKWNKEQCSSQLITTSTGISGLSLVFKRFRNQSLHENLESDSNADAECSVCAIFQKAGKSLI